MDCAQSNGGYPQRLRTDCGTENVLIASIQSFVHQNTRAHIYGTSPANQRIEAWWCFLRRQRAQWWMNLFANLVEHGDFHFGHIGETDCLRFCFMMLLREDLNAVVQLWNTHRIRPSRQSLCPGGIPNELYYIPQSPAVDCLLPNVNGVFPIRLLQELKEPTVCAAESVGEYLKYICGHYGWQAPSTVDEALGLYRRLAPFVQTV